MNTFNYNLAFSRNLGWLTESEQEVIKSKKVAIAGMGGVGGQYAEVLARLGVTQFHISDFDEFEVQNFNRQNCSGMKNLHRKKVEVLAEKILDINPEAKIKMFPEGVREENLGEFLSGVDLYLDGLDFFVLDVREKLFLKAQELKIPAITVAPIGMGASLVVFNEQSMSFKQHFGFKEGDSLEIKATKFLLGLAPTLKHAKYLIDRSKSNFKAKKAPSLPMGPYLCAGVAGTTALKILLNRGELKCSPCVLHFDAYLQSYHKTHIFMGFNNPFQKIKFVILKKMLGI